MELEKSDSRQLNAIRNELQELKSRITSLETSVNLLRGQKRQILPTDSDLPDDDFEISLSTKSDDSIEFRVGEYGMAWLGNIVLLFGISFLVQYLQNAGYPTGSALIGFVSVAGIYSGSYFTRTSYSYLSKLFAYNGHLLLYYMAVRLHFFQEEPFIPNSTFAIFVVLLALAFLFYQAYRQKSQLMTGMVLFMILTTGVITGSILLASLITSIAALLAIFAYYRFGWLKLVFSFIFLVYLAHLNWLLNNPILGNHPEFIQSPGIAYICFIASGFIFSLLALIPEKGNSSGDFIITSVVWNGLGFSFILAIIVFTYFSKNYVPVFATIAILCIAYSVLLQSRSNLKITASMYALYGFLAMSMAFYGILLLPKAYMLLAIQSLLVVSMALWFRSRFILVMNTILFVLLLTFYLADKSSLNATNFSFLLVAFITARVINWKKERLNLKTELIRNIYLISGFIMTLVAFYHVFPSSYITVSWIVAAMLFFLMSCLMKNFKYRWLAIAALVASGIKLIFADMSNIDIGYRVLLFLFLAIISITVSILYTKHLTRKKE